MNSLPVQIERIKRAWQHQQILAPCCYLVSRTQIWWFWYCIFSLWNKPCPWKGEPARAKKIPGASTDLITRSRKSKKKKANQIGGPGQYNCTCVGNLSGQRPIYLPVWSKGVKSQAQKGHSKESWLWSHANHYWCERKHLSGLSIISFSLYSCCREKKTKEWHFFEAS